MITQFSSKNKCIKIQFIVKIMNFSLSLYGYFTVSDFLMPFEKYWAKNNEKKFLKFQGNRYIYLKF